MALGARRYLITPGRFVTPDQLLKLLIRGGFHAHRSLLANPKHSDPQPFQRGSYRINKQVMAATIRKGDGGPCLAPSYDREGLKHCLTDMDPYLRLVEGLAEPRRVSLGTPRTFRLHLQSDSRPGRDHISATLIGHRSGHDLPAIRGKVFAEQVDHCIFGQHCFLQVSSHSSVSFVHYSNVDGVRHRSLSRHRDHRGPSRRVILNPEKRKTTDGLL